MGMTGLSLLLSLSMDLLSRLSRDNRSVLLLLVVLMMLMLVLVLGIGEISWRGDHAGRGRTAGDGRVDVGRMVALGSLEMSGDAWLRARRVRDALSLVQERLLEDCTEY